MNTFRARMPKRPAIIYITGVALAVSAGCQDPLRRCTSERRLVQSQRYKLIEGIDLPEIDSPRGCGPQALAAVMGFFDPGAESSTIYDALPIRDRPTNPISLLLTARAAGLDATVTKGTWSDLRALVAESTPCLVMFDRTPKVRTPFGLQPPPSYHWGVISGMSEDENEILIAATARRHSVLTREDFVERWSVPANCTIVVRPR